MPKARTVAELIGTYESSLTFDFQAVHGLRLITAVQERDEAELLDLIQWLGPGSAFYAERSEIPIPQALASWGSQEDLLLTLVNLIQHQTYVMKQLNSDKKQPVPEPIPGPRGKKPQRKRSDANDMARAQIAAMRRARMEAQKGA